MSTIHVGIVDDQALFLHGIQRVIDSQPDLSVEWLAANGAEALEQHAQRPVDLVLMDVQMPVLDGIAATAEFARRFPETKVVILTTFDDEDYVVNALSGGASGFLLKDAEPEVLLDAIRTVTAGDAVISPRATKHIISRLANHTETAPALPKADRLALDELTVREHEVLVAIGRGWSNSEIAERMFISMPTVKTHVGRILAKTQSRDRVHAALFAYRTGLVDRADLLAHPEV
ncbi:response regulator transcription factor [Corynebacterium imitans]|uniref:response regulator n=1 Tax=Corynebacterium imitans TaxID=156978 RepID=UPI002550B2FF|nr:response regulator transcription factor [Corynebacterium imitans]MDK8306007.1 response regulator transcription factor [Corynebacterium imitans]MDK8636888.1 response regulator transcription factor [Corynebacterium imitans]MDK8772034.1 response regulator transcription factor [Corynebacterium imitans]